LGNDTSANELLEGVVNDLMGGRSRSQITHELVKHGWEQKAAAEFCRLAEDIANELRSSPDQRAACARRGLERIQAAGGWVGSGLVIGLVLNFGNAAVKPYAVWSLAVVAYGLVELISGLALWWPHKDFVPDSALFKTTSANKKP